MLNQSLNKQIKIGRIILFIIVLSCVTELSEATSETRTNRELRNKIDQIIKNMSQRQGFAFRRLWSELNILLIQIDTGKADPNIQTKNGANKIGFDRVSRVRKKTTDPRCIGEAVILESGVDDGKKGGVAGNGILEPGEIDHHMYLNCRFAQPVADAGKDLTVELNSVVILDGSGSSDPAGDPLTYNWTLVTQPEGSVMTIDNPNSNIAEFRAESAGKYVVHLVVSNGYVESPADSVTITAMDCTIDLDEDGEVDCYDACIDVDGDGYGKGLGCSGNDCNDLNKDINPEQLEECDRQDNNCDGEVDEGCACQPIAKEEACHHFACGNVSDGCGGFLVCGFCPASNTCVDNLCEEAGE